MATHGGPTPAPATTAGRGVNDRSGGVVSGAPPEPVSLTTLDDLAARLADLREWAGNPSYTQIARRVADARIARGLPASEATPGRVTVYDCFRAGRTRIDPELLADIVAALGAGDRVPAWRLVHAELERRAIPSDVAHVESPPDVASRHFVGRQRELRWLLGPYATRVTVLVGMPGVGKSELVRRAAERLRGRGVKRAYLVNLRGYDDDQSPAEPITVLGALLRRLGVSGAELMRLDLDDRIERCRTLLPDRSALVVLDNARDADQLEPLLAALTGPQVLVTSRNSFARPPGAGRSDWSQVEVSPLPVPDSVALLRSLAPAAPLAEQPEESRRLVELCGGLPLDLVLTGARLAETPEWTLADQVRRLESVPPADAVGRSLATSYAALPERSGRLFRLLALHPGESVSRWAAAALAGWTVAATERELAVLRAEHLVFADEHGRVRLHDVVRRYAAQLSRDIDPHSARVDAVRRLLQHYAVTAQHACQQLRGSDLVPTPPEGVPMPDVGDVASARDWLSLETSNLLAAALFAGEHGSVDEVAAVAAAVAPWLEADGLFTDAVGLHQLARRAVDSTMRAVAADGLASVYALAGDLETARHWATLAVAESAGPQRIAAQIGHGQILLKVARITEAHTVLTDAVESARQVGSRFLEGRATSALAAATQYLGRFEAAEALFTSAAAISEEVGDLSNVAEIFTDMPYLYVLSERWADAERVLLRALELQTLVGMRTRQALTMATLGEVRSRLGDHDEALALIDAGLSLAEELEQQVGVGACLVRRGEVELRKGWVGDAARSLDDGLAIGERLNIVWIRADASNGLGEVAVATGDCDTAVERFALALELARAMGDPFETARAWRGLGDCAARGDNDAEAIRCWGKALAAYGKLGNPQADRLAGRIAELRRAR